MELIFSVGYSALCTEMSIAVRVVSTAAVKAATSKVPSSSTNLVSRREARLQDVFAGRTNSPQLATTRPLTI